MWNFFSLKFGEFGSFFFMKTPLYRSRFGKNLLIEESLGGRGDRGTHRNSGKFSRIGSGPILKQHFFYWQIFANFDLKSMISMDSRDFSCKKWLKFVIFQRLFSPNCQILMISSSM
jgi:hypothetical protein